VFAVSETVDAVYTLWHMWAEDVCALVTTGRTCVARVTPSILTAIAYGFFMTALSLDRLRATRAMMGAQPALLADRTPYAIIVVVLVFTLVFVGGILSSALIDDRPLAVCAPLLLVNGRSTTMQLLPLVVTYMCNVAVMSFVGRHNERIYGRFKTVVHERQSLAMRAQLKRNMATSRALTPAMTMSTLAFAVLAVVVLVVNALDASDRARHLTDHGIHAVVLTTNAIFAVTVLRMHDNLRATMTFVLGGRCAQIVTGNKVVPVIVLPKKTSTAREVEDDGAKYHRSLAKSWNL